MFANFLFRKAIDQKLDGMTPVEQDALVRIIEKYPDVFAKIAREFKDAVSKGKDQTQAALEVIKNHENELRVIRD